MSASEWIKRRDAAADSESKIYSTYESAFMVRHRYSFAEGYKAGANWARAEALKEVEVLFAKVHSCLNSDDQKFLYWFTTPNPMFGDGVPLNLIRMHRLEKLLAFIESVEWASE